jgi:CubicO group peptidase (beta-lactamase class C family)
VLCLLVATSALAQAAAVGAPPDLDAFVGQVMKTFEVPGLSVAVVKDGKVVVAKGYGVRKLGDPAPVDGKTLFGIASNDLLTFAAVSCLLVLVAFAACAIPAQRAMRVDPLVALRYE